MSTLLKTNSKKYLTAWEPYIDSCIEVEGDAENGLVAKLIYASGRFADEYCHPANVQRYPSRQARLAQYLAGIPFHFDFMNAAIIDANKRLHGVETLTERQASMMIDCWFEHCAMMLIRIGNRHGVTF